MVISIPDPTRPDQTRPDPTRIPKTPISGGACSGPNLCCYLNEGRLLRGPSFSSSSSSSYASNPVRLSQMLTSCTLLSIIAGLTFGYSANGVNCAADVLWRCWYGLDKESAQDAWLVGVPPPLPLTFRKRLSSFDEGAHCNEFVPSQAYVLL